MKYDAIIDKYKKCLLCNKKTKFSFRIKGYSKNNTYRGSIRYDSVNDNLKYLQLSPEHNKKYKLVKKLLNLHIFNPTDYYNNKISEKNFHIEQYKLFIHCPTHSHIKNVNYYPVYNESHFYVNLDAQTYDGVFEYESKEINYVFVDKTAGPYPWIKYDYENELLTMNNDYSLWGKINIKLEDGYFNTLNVKTIMKDLIKIEKIDNSNYAASEEGREAIFKYIIGQYNYKNLKSAFKLKIFK